MSQVGQLPEITLHIFLLKVPVTFPCALSVSFSKGAFYDSVTCGIPTTLLCGFSDHLCRLRTYTRKSKYPQQLPQITSLLNVNHYSVEIAINSWLFCSRISEVSILVILQFQNIS